MFPMKCAGFTSASRDGGSRIRGGCRYRNPCGQRPRKWPECTVCYKLGGTKIINAASTYTFLTAPTMPPPVQSAVARASRNPVRLIELQTKAGEYLAKRLRSEAAMVTAGAASALTIGTSACLVVMNKCTPVVGLKNEVIVPKTHRYGYDHALTNCGIRFVEVETLAEYEAAFNDHTAMAQRRWRPADLRRQLRATTAVL